MKSIFANMFFLALLFFTLATAAQPPQKISYQAVIRNSNGDILSNTQVGIRTGILQNSPAGAAVYQEVYSQNPVTNAFGVITLSIGSGNPQIGNFSAINWAGADYYIRIEIDPAGGNNYSHISTSQLLTVPYAFYSAATGASVPSHYVGEYYGGGIVFYVDHTGNHGLICSVTDLSSATTWSDQPTALIGTAAQSDWNGESNSSAMILQSLSASAADLCDVYVNPNYGTGAFSDWYLPAIDQLNLLYHAKYHINKIMDSDGNGATVPIEKAIYWSSTENSAISAWAIDFTIGTIIGNDKLCTPSHVRAVRNF
jgi:hypothetical protein